jgi:hypothetical protein
VGAQPVRAEGEFGDFRARCLGDGIDADGIRLGSEFLKRVFDVS